MNCNKCGSNNTPAAKFCESCGASFALSSTQNTQTHNMPQQHGGAVNAQYSGANNYTQPTNTQAGGNYQNSANQAPNYQNGQNQNFQNNSQNGKKKKGCARGCFTGCLTVFIILLALFIIGLLLPDDTDDYSSYGDDTAYNESGNNYGSGSNDGEGTFGEDLALTDVRDFHTAIKGDGTDVSTIMVYLLGSDLESDGGYASGDIEEMMRADFGDNVNLIIMTGGSYYWDMREISGDTCQYWQVKDGELISIDDNLGLLNMAEPETLTKFINDTVQSYPADRYSIILWNHGGGTMSGFGYDEHYPYSTLTLSTMEDAFAQSSVKFDFVGFDACLMATAETALMLEPYADYMIASQETEPGTGWHYENWLTYLSENPSADTVDVGVHIIDDFVEACEDEMRRPNATLSIVELRQMPYLYDVLTDYFANSTADIINNEYRKISVARSDAKDFGDGDYEQIDMVDYVYKADVDGGDDVIDAVGNAVKYYKNSSDVSDAYGLAMYFPQDYINEYSDIQDILHDVGYTPAYTEFFNVYISAMSGGQIQYSQSTGTELEQDYSEQDWYDADTAQTYQESSEGEFLGELYIYEKGDSFVLSLTDEEWDEINKIELQALLDDGEGYIDLGSDNVYEFDDDGDLLVEFDYTWVTLNGHTVPFYAEEDVYESDDDWYTYGMVPALLNSDEYIEIIVYWDNEIPTGYVAGYRKYSEVGAPLGKGLFQLESGDSVEWVFDYYSYDWDYIDSYVMGDTFVANGRDIKVTYSDVGDLDAVVYFKLTDIYNNVYETEAVVYSDY